MTATEPKAGSSRGGTILGILLILAGVLFLAGRWVPWLDLASSWPLIIVALGLVQAFRGRDIPGVLDGLTTVIVGGILLANTTGMLSWGAWASILSLWPLLLIAAGISIVGHAVSQSWLRIVAQLLIMAGLLYGAFGMPATTWRVPVFVNSWESVGPMTSFSESAVTGSGDATVTTGSAAVRWGAAEVNVTDGSGLASMSGRAPQAAQPTLVAMTSGSRADVVIGREGPGGAGPGGRLDVTLGRDIRWQDVEVAVGASSGTIDLSDLEVSNVTVDTGASDMTLVIGTKSPKVGVQINAGVTNVLLRVPKSAGVAIRIQGIVASTLPPGYRVAGGGLLDRRWEGGARDSSIWVEAHVQGGIVNVDVETY